MHRLRVPNRVFFYSAGFACDCYNYIAILGEVFLADTQLRATEFQMGLLGAFAALGYALPCIWTGLLSERIGRRTCMLIATGGLLLAYLITPRVVSMEQLYLVTFMRSVATSFYWPALMAWMTETARRGSLSSVLGGYNTSWALGILVGYGLCGWLFEFVSPAAPFHLAALLALGTFLFLFACTPGRLDLEGHAHDMTVGDARSWVWRGLLLNTLGYFSAALVLYMFPKVVGQAMGETEQSLLHVVRMLGQVIVFLLLALTHVWHFKRWPLVACLGCYAGGLVLIALTQRYEFYVAGFALLGVGCGVSYTLCAFYVFGLMRVKGFGGGIQESLIGAGNFLGPLYGGVTATLSNPRTSVLAGLLPVAVVLLYIIRPRRGANHSAEASATSSDSDGTTASPRDAV